MRTFSSLPAVVIACAAALAICTTQEPTPPEPPWTKSVSPEASRARPKRRVGRDPHQGNRRRLLVRNARGRRVEPLLVHGRVLGKGPLEAEEALVAPPDAVAGAEPRHPRAERLDHSGQVAADDVRLGEAPCGPSRRGYKY